MAGERTEEATPRRRQDARKKGQVARSADLIAGLNLLAAALVLRAAGPWAGQGIVGATRSQLSSLVTLDWGGTGWDAALGAWARTAALAAVPLLAILLAVGLVAGAVQTGFLVSGGALSPQFNRLNPAEGLKRLFSLRALTELAKALLKALVVGFAGWQALSRVAGLMPALVGGGVSAAVGVLADVTGTLLLTSGGLLTALGGIDYGYQWWDHQRQLRMTREEVREEVKQSEGSPELRSRRRQRMRELVRRRRMLQEVPTASVVITNPTHFAVALRYRPEADAAPVLVARGRDVLALEIRRRAEAAGVPVVADPPLARSLYRHVPLTAGIPPEFYQAVARVLAYIQRLESGQA